MGSGVAAATAASASAAPGYPVSYDFLAGFGAGYFNPQQAPPGANVDCHPSEAHPDPVVLVHGTFENQDDNWQALSPLLANNGYCVYTFNYGGATPGTPIQGTGDIPTSAGQLAAFVDQVLSTTHAAKVDIVGHSQGGMMPRYYLDFLGGTAKVNVLVGLSPSNHGTTLFGLLTLGAQIPGGTAFIDSGCTACAQQTTGSPFLQRLNAGGDTRPGVAYTVIETTYDEVVTPYTSAFLTGPDVTDITLQQQCPQDFSDHLTTPYDPNALHDVLNALSPATASPVSCVPVAPLVGSAVQSANLTAQSITFTSTPPGHATVGASYLPKAKASSGLAVALSIAAPSSRVCALSSGVVRFTAAGSCVIDANQAGDGTYSAAPQVQQSVTVAPQVITSGLILRRPLTAAPGAVTALPATSHEVPASPVVLADTGSNTLSMLLDAGLLVSAGLALTLVARRGRSGSPPV
jgi:triacylglycerol esterase/lipase EstA (alpha/beta hydrolase family)